MAWTALFAEDADFIHVLGGHFHGRVDIEHGHRTIFDTIYKGSRNNFKVEGFASCGRMWRSCLSVPT